MSIRDSDDAAAPLLNRRREWGDASDGRSTSIAGRVSRWRPTRARITGRLDLTLLAPDLQL
jgi:hypothetical protein